MVPAIGTCACQQVLRLEHLLVKLELHLRHLDRDVDFNLVRQLCGSICLGAAKHERFEYPMQYLHDHEFCCLTHLWARPCGSCLSGICTEIEPAFELFAVVEDLWHQEVQQTPQLHYVILQWGSCQQQSARRVNLAS